MNFTRDCVLCLWIVFDDTVSWVCTYMYSNLFKYSIIYIYTFSTVHYHIVVYRTNIYKYMCISTMYVDKCLYIYIYTVIYIYMYIYIHMYTDCRVTPERGTIAPG